MTNLRAIDVCAGAGGWAVAARDLPITITAAFDRDECYLATYHKNHPSVSCIHCDVTSYDFSRYTNNIDLILGAIPCEDISAARRNVPLPTANLDALSTLLERCLALPEELNAQYWCFEDVTDILRYTPLMTPHFILDSQEFGPQRRKRSYLGNTPLPPSPANSELLGDYLRPGPYRQSQRLADRTPGRSHIYGSSQFYPWLPTEKSPTVINLSSRHDNYAAAAFGSDWRQLEWQELALLQGFPPNYLFIGSPTQTMKQIAQAVEIRTARAILSTLCAVAIPSQPPPPTAAPENTPPHN